MNSQAEIFPLATCSQECCICFEESFLRILPCIHQLCSTCVELVNVCPMCQYPVPGAALRDALVYEGLLPNENLLHIQDIDSVSAPSHYAQPLRPALFQAPHIRIRVECSAILTRGPRKGALCQKRVSQSALVSTCPRHTTSLGLFS
jgi:hypothetical protein